MMVAPFRMIVIRHALDDVGGRAVPASVLTLEFLEGLEVAIRDESPDFCHRARLPDCPERVLQEQHRAAVRAEKGRLRPDGNATSQPFIDIAAQEVVSGSAGTV